MSEARVQGAAARSAPTVTTEVIGPKEARRYLQANTHNRAVRENVIRAYARDMVAGKWFPAVETVTFDWNGVLLNGQHTLMGVMQASAAAGKEIFISVIVVRNQDPQAQDVIDTQPKRTTGDQLALHGEANANLLASAARLGMMLDLFGSEAPTASRQLTPTHQEIIQYVTDNPGLRQSMAGHTGTKVLVPGASAVALHYLMARRSSFHEASVFWDKVATGAGLDVGDPIFALRRVLVNNLGDSRKMDRWSMLAIVIKAWNATRRGQQMKLLAYKAGEEFPVVV